MARRTHRRCPNCNQEKRLDYENFSPLRRNPDGTIAEFGPYCRPCSRALRKDRYANDERMRRMARERARKQRQRDLERCAIDPEFAVIYHERRNRPHRPKDEQPSTFLGNAGPSLPANPLIARIEEWMAREGLDEATAGEILGTTDRRIRDWRQPGYMTRMQAADEALIGMGLNWFDIWPPDEYPEAAKVWDPETYA